MQLMCFSRVLKEKLPQYQKRHDKVILQHDNARLRVARPVKTYLETLKWEVLPHPPYSPDVAPSDYHLFRLMAHGLAFPLLWRRQEMDRFVDRLERRIMFLRWYSNIARRKMEKSSGWRSTVLRITNLQSSQITKPQILGETNISTKLSHCSSAIFLIVFFDISWATGNSQHFRVIYS